MVWIRKPQLQLLDPYCFVLPLYLYIKSELSEFMGMRSDEISHRGSNEKSFWKFEKILMKIPRRRRTFRGVTVFLRPPLHNHFCWALVNKWFIQVFLNYLASMRHYSAHQLNVAWAQRPQLVYTPFSFKASYIHEAMHASYKKKTTVFGQKLSVNPWSSYATTCFRLQF